MIVGAETQYNEQDIITSKKSDGYVIEIIYDTIFDFPF